MFPASDSPSEIVLFGVRVTVDPLRKSVSMNNLSEYEPTHDCRRSKIGDNSSEPGKAAAEDGGYASDDGASRRSSCRQGTRERKRGIPWTEEEHKLFLIGLQELGKGDWRGISLNYVKTRTPTQVASHAQKYFIRRTNLSQRRRRSSLFDITTTDRAKVTTMEDIDSYEEKKPLPSAVDFGLGGYPTNTPSTVLSSRAITVKHESADDDQPMLPLGLSLSSFRGQLSNSYSGSCTMRKIESGDGSIVSLA